MSQWQKAWEQMVADLPPLTERQNRALTKIARDYGRSIA